MPPRRQLFASLAFLAILSLLLSLATSSRAAGSSLALTTILDGEATLVRGESRFGLSAGVPLQADDIIEVPDKTGRLLRIEFADGVTLDLGPATRALLAPRLAGERGRARAYLLGGWAKVLVPAKTAAVALLSPGFDATGISGNAVLALMPDGAAQAFAESGEITLRLAQSGSAPLTLRPNEWMSLAPGAKPVVSPHPGAGFVQQVPRPFLDPLPSRAALFAGKEREAKPVGPVSYADAQAWLDNPEPAMRRLALQRWRTLARNGEFRAGLIMGLKAHPEWQPVLFPPPPPSPSAPGAARQDKP